VTDRGFVFKVSSPVPDLVETIALHTDTWEGHILTRHPDMLGRVAQIQTTVEQPKAIVASRTVSGRLLFVSGYTVSHRGHPLTVAVDSGTGQGAVTTAHFRSPRRGEIVLWPPANRGSGR
jgi:hypothetical protein